MWLICAIEGEIMFARWLQDSQDSLRYGASGPPNERWCITVAAIAIHFPFQGRAR